MAATFCNRRREQYDLIVYALVDSLVLHSGYSNIRLESYLFTTQAFDDVRKRLKPGGLFVMYNYFRQGWIVARLQKELDEVFGTGNPIVLNLPDARVDRPVRTTCCPASSRCSSPAARSRLRDAFARRPSTGCRAIAHLSPNLPNGFEQPSAAQRREWRGLSERTACRQQMAAVHADTGRSSRRRAAAIGDRRLAVSLSAQAR